MYFWTLGVNSWSSIITITNLLNIVQQTILINSVIYTHSEHAIFLFFTTKLNTPHGKLLGRIKLLYIHQILYWLHHLLYIWNLFLLFLSLLEFPTNADNIVPPKTEYFLTFANKQGYWFLFFYLNKIVLPHLGSKLVLFSDHILSEHNTDPTNSYQQLLETLSPWLV